jgi:hypothetical protein
LEGQKIKLTFQRFRQDEKAHGFMEMQLRASKTGHELGNWLPCTHFPYAHNEKHKEVQWLLVICGS